MAHAKFRPLSSIASYVFMADGNPGFLPPSKLFDEGEVRRYERSTSAAGDRHIRDEGLWATMPLPQRFCFLKEHLGRSLFLPS